jgi:hypothetical protein
MHSKQKTSKTTKRLSLYKCRGGKSNSWQVLVTHTCNPSYSGGRDQEDRSSKPIWANSMRDPISKNSITKNWAGGVAQGEGPQVKPQNHTKKKKNSSEITMHLKILILLM